MRALCKLTTSKWLQSRFLACVKNNERSFYSELKRLTKTPNFSQTKLHTQVVGFYYASMIGWYNDLVAQNFKLKYPPDTLAFILISTPAMFEEAFIPFICRQSCLEGSDPLDQCIRHHMAAVKEKLSNYEIDIMHDFEMLPNRQPKVLVQTAGHAAGACYFYQRKDVKNPPWDEKKKIYGVSVHPKYGGWFALRSVVVIKDLLVPELVQVQPTDCLPEDEKKIEVLDRFNGNWADWTYRDVLEPISRYSDLQKHYFATPPKDRFNLLEQIRAVATN